MTSIYKIIKGTFLSTEEEGRDDKNARGARKKGGVFFFHLVGGTVEGVRCCVRTAKTALCVTTRTKKKWRG